MTEELERGIKEITQAVNYDPGAMIDILLEVQRRFRAVSPEAVDLIAKELDIPRITVEDTVTFYSVFSRRPQGQTVIRIGDDIIDEFKGSDDITRALIEELGIEPGQTTTDGLFSLVKIPYIGIPDQAPSLMINSVIISNVKPETVPGIVRHLRETNDPHTLVTVTGDGNNSHELVRSMINNNIRIKGPVLFGKYTRGASVKKALTMSAEGIIAGVKKAKLRGRGGAGFPTGMKWEFGRKAGSGRERYVLCNADEGEPGTFKDRVLLTERADLMFDGMTICAYATGAFHGILYLRFEYSYLREFLEDVLEQRRREGLLGKSIGGTGDFDFDIRIQMGAGAYVCGEETGMIDSCEGRRGDPKNRPPFPVQKGFRGLPTIINNVETFCCAARIVEKGAEWFSSMGSGSSPGTKLLSVCGDCDYPGIYEVPFGIRLNDLLKIAGASNPYAVVVGGASGLIVGKDNYSRSISYDDLSTSGAVIVLNKERDLFRVVEKFTGFFMDESCGHCTPCRVGTYLLRMRLKDIREGRGSESDISYLEHLGKVMKTASRCALGQVAPNPVFSTLKSFRSIYDDKFIKPEPGCKSSFDIYSSIAAAEKIAGRKSTCFPH